MGVGFTRWERRNANHDPRLKSTIQTAVESPENINQSRKTEQTKDAGRHIRPYAPYDDWREEPGLGVWWQFRSRQPSCSFHLVPLRSTIEIPITQLMLVVSGGELLPESIGCFGAVNSLNDYYRTAYYNIRFNGGLFRHSFSLFHVCSLHRIRELGRRASHVLKAMLFWFDT
jgi:hypothetical protein